MPHYLIVPEPTQVVNMITNEPICEPVQETDALGNVAYKKDEGGQPVLKACVPWTMFEFIARYVLSNQKILKGTKAAKFGRRMKKLKTAKAGDVFVIDDEDLETLKKALEEVECPTTILAQMDNIFDAIDAASKDDPREKKE